MRPELRHTLELAAGSGLSSLLRVIYVVYAARVLGPAEYADFYAALTISFLFLAGLAPVAGAVTRFLSLYRGRGEEGKVAALVEAMPHRVRRWALWLCGLSLAAVWPIAHLLQFRSLTTAFVLAAILPLNFLIDTPRGILRGAKRFMAFSVSVAGEAVLRLALCVLAFVAVRSALAGLAAQALATVAALWLVGRQTRGISDEPADPDFDMTEIDRFIPPLFAFAAFAALFQNLDILFVKAFFDGDAAGRFSAVSALSKLVWLAFLPFAILALPLLTEAFSGGRSIWPPLLRTVGGFALVTGGIVGVFAASGEALLRILYGADYSGGGGVLVPLSIAAGLAAASVLIGQAFTAMNRFGFLKLYATTLVLQLALMVAWRDSIERIVLAVVLAQLGLLVALLWSLGRETRRSSGAAA